MMKIYVCLMINLQYMVNVPSSVVRACLKSSCQYSQSTKICTKFLPFFVCKIKSLLEWDNLSDGQIVHKLHEYIDLYITRIARIPGQLYTAARTRSFDSCSSDATYVPTLETLCFFLHDHPMFARNQTFTSAVWQIRNDCIDFSALFSETQRPVFEAWVREHGEIARSYTVVRARRVQFKVCLRVDVTRGIRSLLVQAHVIGVLMLSMCDTS